MATNRTEQLIVDLAADASPVRRLPSITARTAQWVAVAIAVAAVSIWIIGIREDVSQAIAEPAVWWSLALAAVASLSAALVALRLSVPGADRSQWTRWMPMCIVMAWAAMLWRWSMAEGAPAFILIGEPLHAACVTRVIAIALIPTVALTRSVRRGFALDIVWSGALAALGGSAIAAAAVELVCPIDRSAHVFVSHLLPMLALAGVGALSARSFSRSAHR